MRSRILCHRGGWRARKRCGPSGWVLVWVTLHPRGLDRGDWGRGAKRKPSLFSLWVRRHTKKSRRVFTSEVAVMLPRLYARVGLGEGED